MISSSELWFYPFEEQRLNLNYGWYILNAILILLTHQPQTEDLTQAWLLNVLTSEIRKGSFNPVLFEPPYLKLLQVNIKINSKTTLMITSIQGNLVLLSLALLYLSLVFHIHKDIKLWYGNNFLVIFQFEATP